MHKRAKLTLSLLTILGALALWEVISLCAPGRGKLFPPPSSVIASLLELLRDHFLADIVATMRRVIAGYVMGAVPAIVFGTLTARIPALEYTLGSIFQVLRPLTVVALAPFFLLLLGLSEFAKYSLVAWGTFFPIWIGVHVGIRSVDKRYEWAARSLGASSLRTLIEVSYVVALPIIMTGFRTAISIAFVCVFAAETSASEGVGYRLNIAYQNYQADRLLACLIVLGVLGALTDRGFVGVVRHFYPHS